MNKMISSFHYLTQDLPHFSHQQQVLSACEAGVDWIQLRMKNKSGDELRSIADECRKMTLQFNVTLIINDYVELAKEVRADGVHLGQSDLSWQEARFMVGNDFIIGLSVHTVEELEQLKFAEADYYGVGPFRFTSTKENIDPVLAIEGVHGIISYARSNKILQPVIAIGGIQLQDVPGLFECGVSGVAVSSAINLSSNPVKAAVDFMKAVEKNKEVYSSKEIQLS